MSTKTIRDVAFELYKPPFYFLGGYVWDSGHHMVLDQHTDDGDTADAIVARIRGWGRIQYMDKPELRAAALQDEVGKLVAEALNAAWERRAMEDAAQAQQEPRTLTDEEIYEIADSPECNPDDRGWGPKFSTLKFARAVLAAHTGEAADRSSLPATGGERG